MVAVLVSFLVTTHTHTHTHARTHALMNTHTHTHIHTQKQCHVSSVPVYAGLKKRNLKVYSLVVAVAVTICVLVYTLTGTFGYMTFAPHFCFNSDVLRNYCPNDVAVNIARAVLAFVIVTSYPILAFCGRYVPYVGLGP